jgi:hypothetical protein
VAIARTEEATVIYSDDEDIRRFGKRLGLEVIGLNELPMPPANPQPDLLGEWQSGDDDVVW